MDLDACFYLGYTAKVHGKNGDLIIKPDVDFPEEYQNLESVFIQLNKEDKTLVPFFLTTCQLQANKTLRIKIEDTDDADTAKKMVGKSVFLPLNLLPPLTGNKFYFHEIIGFSIIDSEKGNIGKVTHVLEHPTQAIFEITNPNQKEILIPITDEIITKVDRENKTINVITPDGLIDLYLE
jgi:16S rRNA processing protein RimM